MNKTPSLEDLIKNLKENNILKSKEIEMALYKVDRKLFLPKNKIYDSYVDSALPTVGNSTISQPSTVVFMLEKLKLKKDQKVLEIGGGSGWVAALISHVIGEKGYVYSGEISRSVAKFGKKNIKNFLEKNKNISNIDYIQGDFSLGYYPKSPFDRIIVSAAYFNIPKELLSQLSDNGILITPTTENYIKVITKSDDNFTEELFFGFSFVPIIQKNTL